MPGPAGVARRVLLTAVLCGVVAIAQASCSDSGNRSDVISVCFPSFKGVNNSDSRFSLSWDAGIVDGALHLTVDDVHKPPVNHPPEDEGRLDGGIILQPASILVFSTPSYSDPYPDSGHDTSFNTTFAMSVSRSRNQTATEIDDGGGLVFEILPEVLAAGSAGGNYSSWASTTSGNISVEVGEHDTNDSSSFGMYVSITPAPTRDAPPVNYTVWIDYDGKSQIISVYVGKGNKPKPAEATLRALNVIRYGYGSYYFGLFASKNRSLPSCQPVIYSWSLTVDRLSDDSEPTYVPATTPMESDHDRNRGIIGEGWFLAIIVVSSVLLGAAAAAAAVFHCRDHIVAIVSAAARGLASRYQALKMKMKLSRELRRLPGVPREFKYADVKKATMNFDESMRLGRGGFGAVYRGTVLISTTGDGEDDGSRKRSLVDIAVKKFTRKEDRGYGDFLAEVAIINRLRHKNIVPLIGWCYENGKLLLIYQYMPNGSLDQHLFRENNGHQHLPPLRWETRYNIIGDVAAGLHYVHHEYERVVLHRDIKASNIMLDDAFGGRLGDFGLARVVGFNNNSTTDVGVAGTWGFIAPEYAVSHRATRQTDVYAFGVLVLEVVTGRRSLSAADAPFPVLADWVWWLHGQGKLLEAMDDELSLSEAELNNANGDARRLLLLGLACSNPKPSDRPSMAEVVQVIGKSMPPPNVPLAKPTFLWSPTEGEPELWDNTDDDLTGVGHGNSDWSHREGTTQSHGGFVISIGSLEISIGRSRKVWSLPPHHRPGVKPSG